MTSPVPPSSPGWRRRAVGRRSHHKGLEAEQKVMDHLRAEGWTILAHRARTAWGEIDIVAIRDGLLVFTEVKARASIMQAGDAISPRTMQRLMNAAQGLCMLNAGWAYDGMRFDVVVVLPDGHMHRIEDAFRME
ncbi:MULTISPECIES: YraN family protein [Novacetimonas]|uniref:YraN family protein n=1 Tax=Novacetimonas TaxID=2919364 RepID=UPI001CE2281F|nr:YraN family protein [Novacetimonas hansenii]